MDFETYQARAQETAIYPDRGANLAYPALGLNGEAGEVAEIVKKVYRDHGGLLEPEKREALKKELGDVLWYVATLCAEAGLSMDDVAGHNIEKLTDRLKRDVLHGSGDTR
jgi:NTP pyrophosphatase (non-canonical NTP hydrolase)